MHYTSARARDIVLYRVRGARSSHCRGQAIAQQRHARVSNRRGAASVSIYICMHMCTRLYTRRIFDAAACNVSIWASARAYIIRIYMRVLEPDVLCKLCLGHMRECLSEGEKAEFWMGFVYVRGIVADEFSSEMG